MPQFRAQPEIADDDVIGGRVLISGAFQHIAGMKDSDCIIAVNKDAEAPIFQYAHFGIIADMHKVRDKLKALVKG